MAKKEKIGNKLSEEEILADIKRLSEQVKQPVAIQQFLFQTTELGEEDLDTTFEKEQFITNADPETSHRLYYTMQMTIRANLPKQNKQQPISDEQHKKNKEIKKFNEKVYAEKKLFLNRGKEIDNRGIRGSDERQTYIPNFLKVGFDVVNRWVAEGADPYDLWYAFYKLNKEKGYRNEGKEKPVDNDNPANPDLN